MAAPCAGEIARGDAREHGATRAAGWTPRGRDAVAQIAVGRQFHHRPFAGRLQAQLLVDLVAHCSILNGTCRDSFDCCIAPAREAISSLNRWRSSPTHQAISVSTLIVRDS